MDEHAKQALDTASFVTLGATLLGWLPAISAIVTIVWMAIRIWETDTVKKWTNRE